MTVAMALAEKLHHSAQPGDGQVQGAGARDELYGDYLGPPSPSHSPAGALQPLRRRAWPSAAGQAFHLSGFCGAPCCRLSMLFLRCRLLTILRRRWWNSCQTSSNSFDTPTPDPEQVIEVPKILPDDVPMRIAVRETQLAEQLVEVPTIVSFSSLQRIRHSNFWSWRANFAVCVSLSRRQNSWWKCRRSSPILLYYSGLWSRTWPSQFLVVEGDSLVFKVFIPDRVQQR